MAASFNKIILVGTLTRDPEIRYIGSGAGVTKFRIAVNPNKRDAKPEDTLFIDIVAWDKLAETCNTYLKKGGQVLIDGRLSIRHYDDKDGNKRQATEVVANAMQMLGSPRDRDASSGGGYGRGGDESSDFGGGGFSGGGYSGRMDDGLDEEIPF